MSDNDGTNKNPKEEDEFTKLLYLANQASLEGDQDTANDLIDEMLDTNRDKLK